MDLREASAKAPGIRWWKGTVVLSLGVHPSIAGGMGFPRGPEMDRISFSHSKHLPGSSEGLFLPTQAGGEALGDRPGCKPQPQAHPPRPTPTPPPGGLTPAAWFGSPDDSGPLFRLQHSSPWACLGTHSMSSRWRPGRPMLCPTR